MYDLRYLTPTQNYQTFVFGPQSIADNIDWTKWDVPIWARMLEIWAIGSGAGGGGGATAAAGTSRGGGGGGGSSGVSRLIIPADRIPRTLYLQVARSAPGGAPGTAGTSGRHSAVSIAPNVTATNLLLISGNAVPTAGGGGTGASAGTAGIAATIATTALCPLSGLGITTFIAGQVGIAGGAIAGAAGGTQTIPTTGVCTMGGTGGAGVTAADFAGGQITAIANSFLSEMRPPQPAAGSVNGSHGILLTAPFWSYCGLGGSSSNTGVGGNGGNGGPGSGGGGGGAGTTGGRGGDGGPGMIRITCTA
jgi:hypothetical protein